MALMRCCGRRVAAWGSARDVDVVMIRSLAPRGHRCLMRLTPGYNWSTPAFAGAQSKWACFMAPHGGGVTRVVAWGEAYRATLTDPGKRRCQPLIDVARRTPGGNATPATSHRRHRIDLARRTDRRQRDARTIPSTPSHRPRAPNRQAATRRPQHRINAIASTSRAEPTGGSIDARNIPSTTPRRCRAQNRQAASTNAPRRLRAPNRADRPRATR